MYIHGIDYLPGKRVQQLTISVISVNLVSFNTRKNGIGAYYKT